jgi:phage terminase large subunit GpA-like protein
LAGVNTCWPTAAQLKAKKSKNPNVVLIGVNAAKDTIYGYLKHENPGPGYCHFP